MHAGAGSPDVVESEPHERSHEGAAVEIDRGLSLELKGGERLGQCGASGVAATVGDRLCRRLGCDEINLVDSCVGAALSVV